MKSKLDGASVARAKQVPTAQLRVLTTEADGAPDPVSISWTPTAHERSAQLRRDKVAVAAYYLSEARGFVPGHDADDWLLAEAQVDAIDPGKLDG